MNARPSTFDKKSARALRAKIYDQRSRTQRVTGGNLALFKRLRQHWPELYSMVMAGNITAHQAAVTAGLRGRRTRQPHPQRVIPSNGNVPTLPIDALAEMRMWLGPLKGNDDERQLWMAHRERLLHYWAHSGRRPQAWWKYESPVSYPGFNLERSTLFTAGLLEEDESRQLEEAWLKEFIKSCEPDFTFRGISQPEAHIEYLVFHDVPSELCELWAADLPEAA